MTENPTRNHRAPVALDWRHILLGCVLLIDAAYIVLVVSGVALTGHEQFLAPQINQLVATILGVGTVTAVGLILTARLAARVDDAVVIVSAVAAKIADDVAQVGVTTKDLSGQVARVKDRMGMREDDDPAAPTVPIVYRQSVQHVIGVASPALYGQRGDAALDRAADRLVERFEEYGQQRYYKGYAACAEDMSGGAVVALTPRNGHRSSS